MEPPATCISNMISKAETARQRGNGAIKIFCVSFFLTSLLEYNCSTMVCQPLLYKKVNQLYIYTHPHTSSLLRLSPTLPIPPLQVITKYRADLPVLCSCFPLAIQFTFGSVYMSMPLSHFVPAYPSPPPVFHFKEQKFG